MDITIRAIRPADEARLAEIIRASIEEFDVPKEGTAYTDPTTDRLYTLFQTPGSHYWVVEAGGHLLGGCGVYPTEGLPDGCAELVRFFLDAQARGKGLGSRLMEMTFDTARELGYRQLYLESFPEMKAAVRLYERAGFYHVPEALGNSGHYACNVWMVKDL
ncbi:N-acetyltransferase family protein [Chitinophaga lutea]